MKLSEEVLSWENTYKYINARERVKPIDTAGKAIAEILRLADENKQLKRDLELMKQSRNGAFDMIEMYVKEKHERELEIKHESQDYSMLAGLVLFVWLGFIGLVING